MTTASDLLQIYIDSGRLEDGVKDYTAPDGERIVRDSMLDLAKLLDIQHKIDKYERLRKRKICVRTLPIHNYPNYG